MEFGRAFTYATEDPDWLKKIGIAALVTLIPIVGQITVLGWALEITRRVINQDPSPLPDWDNFGDFVSKGFQAAVVGFVYALPLIVVSGCLNTVLPFMAQAGSDSEELMTTIITVFSICIGCFNFIYGILLSLVLPAAYGNMAASGGQVSAGFRFNEIIALVRAAPGPYAMVILGAIASSFIASLGIIACVIGVIFTQAYAMTVNAHLWGQAYNTAKGAQNVVASAL